MDVEISERPLVSLLLITYRQEQFIEEAVVSALAQTYSPLEIVLADDCSPDNTFGIMQRIVANYQGPHRVILNRNPTNLGAAQNLNRCWELSKGEFAVIQAGDDISLPDRALRLTECWLRRARAVDLVCSHYAAIDDASQLTGYVKKDVAFLPDKKMPVTRWRCGAAGSCASYSRKLFEKYGGLDSRVIAEDWVFSFRAWVEGGLEVVPDILVKHRKHAGGISVQAKRIAALPERTKRRDFRKREAASSAGIAKEWLHAWRLGRWKDELIIERELRKLSKVRNLQADAYQTGRASSLVLAMKVLALGHARNAMGMVLRHALRIE